jgi:hypothetical protein
MANVSATTLSSAPKAQARVAIIGLDPSSSAILRDCYKQFHIESVLLEREAAETQINRQKYEACVVRLDETAAPILSAVRTSKSNNRMVVYGICSTAQEALRFSQFGINAIFNDPIDRPNSLKVIRGTHLLVVHELRRYVRIPIVVPLQMNADGDRFGGSMHEISGGGMSLETRAPLKIGSNLEVSFGLPKLSELSLRSVVAWVRPDVHLVGLRFDPQEPNRFRVKNWIDQYLDIS